MTRKSSKPDQSAEPKTTPETQPQTETDIPYKNAAIKSRAEQRFGDRANGIFSELIKAVGPTLGNLLLEWILTQTQHDPMVDHSLMDGNAVMSWVMSLIGSHKKEFKEFVNGKTDELIEALLEMLSRSGSSTDPPTFSPRKA